MYKRHTGQVSMLESPEMFGSLPLDPNNDWIKLSKLVPWREFDLKYADNFRSRKGQRAIDSRMALGALLIKPAYKAMSDEDITKEIAMNPYLQYFLGLQEYRYECPFDPSIRSGTMCCLTRRTSSQPQGTSTRNPACLPGTVILWITRICSWLPTTGSRAGVK